MLFAALLRHLRARRYVRPWALSAPILVLILSIPLLRPLRSPDPSLMSDDEQARLATVQAIVEHKTLGIEGTDFRDTRDRIVARSDRGAPFPTHFYSKQPPMLAVILSGPYWVMYHYGLTIGHDPDTVIFLLTLLGITIPAALAAGLVYRMSKIFELSRPRRALLAAVAVIGSGLLSYSTVLNAHAPAATLLLASASCLIHVIAHNQPKRAALWLTIAGFYAALAATIDPPACIFLPLLAVVIAAIRWPITLRMAGVAVYVLGAALPVAVHMHLTRPITGDLRPGMFHPELAIVSPAAGTAPLARAASPALQGIPSLPSLGDDEDELQTPMRRVLHATDQVAGALIGRHGIFSHFPIVLLGIIGVSLIMHRHWPSATKTLAGATLAGAAVIIIAYSVWRTDTGYGMFATRWFVVFLPMTIFWAGAWLRRTHRQSSWCAAGALLAFSVTASIIGATGPLPRAGYDHYSLVAAWQNLIHPPATPPTLPSPIAAAGE